MSSDIFLSYCRADQSVAEQFIKIATARGLTVWYDRMIEGGQDWRGKIVDALGSSKALVILFSEHSNDSHQLIKELAIADNMRKLVVPVLIAKCEPRGAYLYELASRNWVNLHPNPETRLEPLIDTLMKELGLPGRRPRPAPVNTTQDSADQPTAAAQDRALPSTLATQNGPSAAAAVPKDTTSVDAPVAQDPALAPTPIALEQMLDAVPAAHVTPTSLAQDGHHSWFPLERRDLYVLAPILVVALLLGIFGLTGNELATIVCVLSFFGYMLVIATRNARLNRSISSGKSFASYFAVSAIGSSPMFFAGAAQGGGFLFLGLLIIAALLAVIANVLQVLLRKVYQQKIFRSKIE